MIIKQMEIQQSFINYIDMLYQNNEELENNFVFDRCNCFKSLLVIINIAYIQNYIICNIKKHHRPFIPAPRVS